MKHQVVTFILACDDERRFLPLTRLRAKALLPFGGSGRLIDFTLTNCNLSGISRAEILTRNDCISMNFDKPRTWINDWKQLDRKLAGVSWCNALRQPGYVGSVQALRQNLWRVPKSTQEVLVLSSDRIYSMDYRALVEFHRKQKALVTVGVAKARWLEADAHVLLNVGHDNRVTHFQNHLKTNGTRWSDGFSTVRVPMGIYVFDFAFLSMLLRTVAGNDFGRDLLPIIIRLRKTFAFNPADSRKTPFYWRDTKNLYSYWKAQMEWRQGLTFKTLSWKTPNRVETDSRMPTGKERQYDPADGRSSSQYFSHLTGDGLNPVVSNCVFSSGVLVGPGATVSKSILLEGAVISPGARIDRAIVDRNAIVPAGEEVGFNLEKDREKHLVTPEGIVIISPPRTETILKEPLDSKNV